MNAARVKVACINWSNGSAAKAVVYVYDGREARAERFFQTWEDAVKWANELAARLIQAAARVSA